MEPPMKDIYVNFNVFEKHLKNVECFKEFLKIELEENNNTEAFNLMSGNQKIKLISKKGKIIYLIIKYPVTESSFREIYCLRNKFLREYYFYSELLPRMAKVVEMPKLKDLFPKYYSASMEMGQEIIILENLSFFGFKNAKNPLELDKRTFEFALKSLAKFHAAGIAYKWKEPEHFQRLAVKFPKAKEGNSDIMMILESLISRGIEAVRSTQTEQLAVPMPNEFLKKLRYYISKMGQILSPNDPWATISHGDFVINNIMFNESKVKMMDMQMFDCGYSVGMDISKFIYVSSEKNFRDEYLNDLLLVYYNEFVNVLCQVADISQDKLEERGLSFESLINEIEKCLPYTYLLCSYFLGPMMTGGKISEQALLYPFKDVQFTYESLYKLGGHATDRKLRDIVLEIIESKVVEKFFNK